MNRRRLGKLRDTLRGLRPCTHVRDGGAASGYTGTLQLTDTDTLCSRAAGLARIDTLDMNVEHGQHTDGGNGESRVLGCVSGVAILMFPDLAAEAARTLPAAIVVCNATDVAQHVLGLDDETAETLFEGYPDDTAEPITPEEAAEAVEHVLAGTGPKRIWNHVRARTAT